MDKEFTWNRVEPDESLQWKQGGSIEQDIESIKARIGELKAEREQLVAQLEDEYSDEKLAAQMMRAGDEGAMYKFLRGQQDNMRIQELQKEKENKPTQEQFDKVLETLQATEAAIADPNVAPQVRNKYALMIENYQSQLNDMITKNPDIALRNYSPVQKSVGNVGNVGEGGDLYDLKNKLGWEGATMTDDEIDDLAKELQKNPNVPADEVAKITDEAKKRNQTAYDNYSREIDRRNAELVQLHAMWQKADPATKRELEGLIKNLGGGFKTGGKLVKIKKKDKSEWVKGT